MRNFVSAFLICASLVAAAPAAAAELRLGAGDTVQSILATQKGTRVTVRLRSGQEFTGTLREINANVVQLGAIGSREFFDAVIPLDAVEAVLVRTKQ